MHYFIDGYNLLFRLLHGENLQSQREAIIFDLNQKISFVKIDASIVFDSAFQMGGRTRSHYKDLEILFTAEGETADEYILEEIRHHPHPYHETVVTSDRDLAFRVRRFSAHTESVENFMFWLNRAYKNKLSQQKKEQKKQKKILSVNHKGETKKEIQIEKKDKLNNQQTKHLEDQPPTLLLPPKGAPLEAYESYYKRIFESQYQNMIQQDEVRKKTRKELSSIQQKDITKAPQLTQKPRRQPKKKNDPFAPPIAQEEPASSEMERWLKIFEKRSDHD